MRPFAPRAALAADVERQLEETVEEGLEIAGALAGERRAVVDGAGFPGRVEADELPCGEALAELVEDLVLADDDRVEAGGDREEMPDRLVARKELAALR